MDVAFKEELEKSINEIKDILNHFEKVVNIRIEKLKKVMGDYLDLSSNISMATVKANLKSV